MTLRRSLVQRSRSVDDVHRNDVNSIAHETMTRFEPISHSLADRLWRPLIQNSSSEKRRRHTKRRFAVDLFTALHEMQTRSSNENSVRPSVCLSVRLSVCHTRDPWQNGSKIGPDFQTIRKNNYPSFLRRRMVDGGRPLLREILGQPTPVGTKSPIFNQ